MSNLSLVEKYRPKTWDEVIGQDQVKVVLQNILARKSRPPHFLFVGPSGSGKDTCAIIFGKHYLGDLYPGNYIELNASDSRRIEDVRERIKPLSKTASKKIIYLNEADQMTDASQHAMRRIMETSANAVYVLSGNDEYKFIDAIKSRCTILHFQPLSDTQVLTQVLKVCEGEGIKIDFNNESIKKGFQELVKDANGDLRKAINTLETLITAGREISETNVLSLSPIGLIQNSLNLAFKGNFIEAKRRFEEQYIMYRFDSTKMIDSIKTALNSITDQELVARLYSRLGELERNLKIGCNPLIQFTSFLAFSWVIPHVPRSCPVVAKEMM